VEQELIASGVKPEEILELCDIHTAALKGVIEDKSSKSIIVGHPVHTFKMENRALSWEIDLLEKKLLNLNKKDDVQQVDEKIWNEIKTHVNALMDVDKHYLRKENLLFPFLEKHGITGPPTVMWGKHDETRKLLTDAIESLSRFKSSGIDEANKIIENKLRPAINSIVEMVYKENEILFPMCLDKLSAAEWYEVYKQSIEFGFCLYDPQTEWHPKELELPDESPELDKNRIQLASGNFTIPELEAILNTIPFDLSFVDKDDRVRYFTQGKERIFVRNRAILGRKVQHCHPPSSVAVVEQILSDFKDGSKNSCAFWINMRGKFIHIEYYALRDKKGAYLGTLEATQNLTEKRKLEGERRLLSYEKPVSKEKK